MNVCPSFVCPFTATNTAPGSTALESKLMESTFRFTSPRISITLSPTINSLIVMSPQCQMNSRSFYDRLARWYRLILHPSHTLVSHMHTSVLQQIHGIAYTHTEHIGYEVLIKHILHFHLSFLDYHLLCSDDS